MDSNNKPQPTPSKPLPKHEQDALAFRQSVKRLREEKGWTQNHLAEKLREAGLEDFHQITVARLENGRRAVRLGEAGVIANVLESYVWTMLIPEDSLARASHASNEKIAQLQDEAKNLQESVLRYEDSRSRFMSPLLDILDRLPTDKKIDKYDSFSVGTLLGIIESEGAKQYSPEKLISPYVSSLDITEQSIDMFSKEEGIAKDASEFIDQTKKQIEDLVSELSQYFPIITEPIFKPANQDQKAGEP